MDGPNPELMHLYGTDAYYLEKTGQMPGLVRGLAGAAGYGLYQHDKKHVEELLAEAELMNQRLRMVEAAKVQGVAAGFEGRAPLPRGIPMPGLGPELGTMGLMKGGSAFGGAEKVASAMGRQFAWSMYKRAQVEGDHETLELLEKIASGVELTELEKQAFFGKLLGGAGRLLGKVVSGIGAKAAKFGGKTGAGTVRKGLGRAGVQAETAGAKLTQKVAPVVGKSQQVTQAVKHKVPAGSPPPGTYRQAPASTKPLSAEPSVVINPRAPNVQMSGGSMREAVKPRPSATAQQQPVRAVQKPALKQAPAPAPQPVQAAAPTAPAATPAQIKAQNDPWLSWRTKAKIGIGAASLGTGYVGYKGLQTARDYMMMPSSTGGPWNPYGSGVRHNVNPMGY